jgi:hypothetical protein
MNQLARIGLALFGLGCLVAAVVVDMDVVRNQASGDGYFVQTHALPDGTVRPETEAALRTARVALGLFGLMLVGAAAWLPRLFPGHSVQDFLRSRRVHWMIFSVPIIFLVALGGYKAYFGLDTFLYKLIVTEDGPAEYLTAIAFFGGFIISCLSVKLLFAARSYPLAIYFTGIGVSCLFVALEEISYGQRIFGFSTPESIAQHNRQDEFNIHNLEMLQTLSFFVAPLAVGLFGLLGIVVKLLRGYVDQQIIRVANLMFPPWFLSSWFLPLAIFTVYYREGWLVEWRDQELLEALLALGFLGFLARSLSQLRTLKIDELRGMNMGLLKVKMWKPARSPRSP